MAQRAEVVLSGEERETLERWARRPKSAQALAFRCRIVLAAAEGRSSTEIAAELGCNANTVGKWRGRFARRGIDGLHDEPRPGKPRTISDEDVERVIVKTLEEQPADATHWSTRSMAAATGMSQSAVSRIWRAFGLKPHRSRRSSCPPIRSSSTRSATSSGSTSTRPRRRSCSASTRSPRSRRSTARRRSCRCCPGSAGAADPRLRPQRHHQPVRRARRRLRQGDRRADATPPRRGVPRGSSNLIDASVPADLDVHVVLDNSSTHKTPVDPALARPPPPLHAPLHADLQLLAQPRRALVRRADHEMDQTRHPPLSPRPRRLDPHLDHQLERQPQAVRLAQDRRRDPRQPRRLLPADQRLRSLACGEQFVEIERRVDRRSFRRPKARPILHRPIPGEFKVIAVGVAEIDSQVRAVV